MRSYSALLSVTCAIFCGQVSGYGSGAPASACSDMKPGPPHWPNQLSDQEQNQAPFRLETVRQRNGQVKGDINIMKCEKMKILPYNLLCVSVSEDSVRIPEVPRLHDHG